MKADLILFNGKIYKSNKEKEYAEAVCIKDRKFICVGTAEECLKYKTAETKVIDLEGRLVLPGLIDGHTHPETIAKSRWRIQMPEFDDMKELLSWVKAYCEKHPKEEIPYFFGECYPSAMFDENGPKKEWLDEYVSDRPVRLQDFTDHACWYNSKALELMEISRDTPETGAAPFFVRDDTGEPTGWVQEPLPGLNVEEKLYDNLGWHPPTEVTEETVAPFLDFLKDKGVTAILDGNTEGEEAMKLFYDMDSEGRLNMYYEGTCLLESYDKLDECITTLKDWQKKYTNEHVRLHTIKFFLDRTNEMGNGASLEPLYNDPSGTNYGEINMSEAELTDTLLRLNREKIDLHTHVVCDRGFRTACNAYEAAKKKASELGESWDIFMELAHCELVHPDDMARPAELGIIINWSCHWSGGYFGEEAMTFFTEEKWRRMYQFNPIIDSGALVTFSSDVVTFYELHRADPFFSMQVAATRVDPEFPLDPDKYPGSVRPPENAKLDVSFLLKGYTINGAKQMHWDKMLGSIEEGKIANMNVCRENIEEYPCDRLTDLSWDAVIFDGKVIRGEL